MKEIVVEFKKAEVGNYNLDNQSCDIRVFYEVDGKQKYGVIHVTRNDKDAFALAEDFIISTRRLEKNSRVNQSNQSISGEGQDPLANFVNIRILWEDDVPENLARFVTRVMNQGRTNSSSLTIPRYQLRDQLCKLNANL